MEIDGEVNFEPVAEGTRMRWSWDVRLNGIARVAGPLVRLVGQWQERRIWSGLKRLLEQARPSSGLFPRRFGCVAGDTATPE